MNTLSSLLCLLGKFLVYLLLIVVALLADLLINTTTGDRIRELANSIAGQPC
ncbi:hypothetical protein GA0061094_0338 [[Bacillus] enclensis]|jgi:hypothetical protein|uniref:Uncharacterized protein n=1 Tax=[Bacillus] enclensis TaxID=1402860 RepID=A0A1C3Z1H8_9BACI|nr:hypothetical protein [[Bacillus] enclensis]SCB76216.1 hypothetical protein GA0061094_0338 [[Bacillus] enclensis]